MTLRRAVVEAVSTLHEQLTRDAALRGSEGFAEAWAVTEAVPGWFDEASAATFWAVVDDRRPQTVVEIGSYLGRSTTLLGLALDRFVPGASLTAIDPHTGDRQHLAKLDVDTIPTLDLFRVHLEAAGIGDRVDVKVATSAEAAREWGDKPIDFLFVDGWHSYDAVREDITNYAAHLSPHGLVCFDDFGIYDDVRRAVREGCREQGLHLYGLVRRKAWAGRTPQPPVGLVRAMRLMKPLALVNERNRV